MTLKATWADGHREPQCAPDPQFPNGVDIDVSDGAARTCSIEVAYPAPRCGHYIIRCDVCGMNSAITTAGRPDDPRKVTFGCYSQTLNPAPPGMTRLHVPDTPKMRRTPHR
jgi:hypothetical protein